MNERIITDSHIRSFEQQLMLEEKSSCTVRKYLHDVRMFADFCAGAPVMQDVLIAYKEQLCEKYSVRSINSMLASLGSLFSHLGWHELHVKGIRVQRQLYCTEESELTREEYYRLCRAAERRSARLGLILQTIGSTGMRVSELRFVTVEAARCGEAVVRCKGKARVIFLVPELRNRLLDYAEQHGIERSMIFVTRGGLPVDRTNIWRDMKTVCADAGISLDKVFPHNLRHLFARVFYEMDKDIAQLADVLGHSSINTTRLYIVSSGAEHRRRMEDMGLIK
mgnify:FL=1